MSRAVNSPVVPAHKTMNGKIVGLIPRASSIPCTGNGVNASVLVYPESRTLRAASSNACSLENSATHPVERGGFGSLVFRGLCSLIMVIELYPRPIVSYGFLLASLGFARAQAIAFYSAGFPA